MLKRLALTFFATLPFYVCRDGEVSLQEYMGFMISRETENVRSTEEVESAFQALSAEGKPYVTRDELYQVSYVPSLNLASSLFFLLLSPYLVHITLPAVAPVVYEGGNHIKILSGLQR